MKVFSVILLLLMAGCCYILYRNNKVCEFKLSLIDKGHKVCKSHLDSIDIYECSNKEFCDRMKEYERLRKIQDDITEISYDKMLYSFKPLKEKYWLNEEQINFLNNGSY